MLSEYMTEEAFLSNANQKTEPQLRNFTCRQFFLNPCNFDTDFDTSNDASKLYTVISLDGDALNNPQFVFVTKFDEELSWNLIRVQRLFQKVC